MQTNRRVLVLVGSLIGGAACSGLVAVGCAGDSAVTNGTTDGGGSDSTTSPDVEGSGGDASPDVATDGATDANLVADADAGTNPSSDADAGAAPSDADGASTTLEIFPTSVAAAICDRFAHCCAPPGDGSVFDTNGCITRYLNFGYAGSSAGQAALNAGHIELSQAQAQSCLSQIAAIDCSANLRTSAQEQALITACYGALQGTLEAGAPCSAAIECASGQFCNPTDAGSVCAPLRTTGQPCGEFAPSLVASANACSYRGSGNTGLTCINASFVTGDPLPDAGDWKCGPEQAAGQGCNFNVDCQSKLCDPGAQFNNFTCVGSETFIYPFACQSFTIAAPVDAGATDSGHD